jgi:hypothetical protein
VAAAVTWRLAGYDAFSCEDYPLEGTYDDEPAALRAAGERLAYLERTQPSAHSGGQGITGIQDRVYVVCPDGTRYRVFPALASGRP